MFATLYNYSIVLSSFVTLIDAARWVSLHQWRSSWRGGGDGIMDSGKACGCCQDIIFLHDQDIEKTWCGKTFDRFVLG